MTTQQYIESINQRFKLGNATEHTFRGDLARLIETLVPDVVATNEPKRQTCGAPDYILTKKDIPVGFIEAKDIGDSDLDGKKKTGNKEQFDRYKASLENLIFTDYLNFHLYRNGEFITKISIAEISGNQIKPIPENFSTFENLVKDFAVYVGQTIKSPRKLAEMMAGKARLLADIISNALISDESSHQNSTLRDQMEAFKEILIHDITPKAFADVYAQTIAYGMFAARLHDPTLPTFSRHEAAELIPKSNPFLRKLFGYIAGPDLDDRIKWIVDSLVDIFLASNVEDILKDYGKSTKMENPIIHFYETFLSDYDPKLRKSRGVWYTPAPVVNFIVRAVDDILKTEFGLPQGLADTGKTKITVQTQNFNAKKQKYETVEKEVHKVQILDPATGTGTFLAEVVEHVHKKFAGQQGIWSNYVEKHLIPRLNGFELLMASYAMAHLQLDLLLKETGFKVTTDERLRVYLTNSLEESHPDTNTLFASWLSDEANEANRIKRDTPVMVIIGNPPYSGESANKGDWIMKLMEDYKKEPGGKEKLKEKNSKSINADEYKFIRYGQHFIENNGSGILAFINPHTFLDTPVFRGMRWNLLNTFDKIFTLDLHGNTTKKETAPDGGVDTNVFDIKQGVSINFFVKTGQKKSSELGVVYHSDLFGKREYKYEFLAHQSFAAVKYNKVKISGPNYYFVPKDYTDENSYFQGFELIDLMEFKTSGIKTHDDKNLVAISKEQLRQNIESLGYDFVSDRAVKYWYRPLDNQYVYYETNLLGRPRQKTIYHLANDNVGLVLVAQPQVANLNFFDCVYVTDCFADTNIFRRGGPVTFPLYLYPEAIDKKEMSEQSERIPNLNMEIINRISDDLKLAFLLDENLVADLAAGYEGTFSPLDVLDYIYAVLHSPSYREKYKEFLKIDFPRIPYPTDAEMFRRLVSLGKQIRELHLLESPAVEQYITEYPVDGDNIVDKPVYKNGNVYINSTQYFSNVPEVAWNFYIGGYQPAQKWLKDRKGRPLDFEDILHYQKIIVALAETERLMREVDIVVEEFLI